MESRGWDRGRVGRVDRRLAVDARHPRQGLVDRAARDGDHDRVGVRAVPALMPEHRDLVACVRPQPGETTAYVSAANDNDLHLDSLWFRGAQLRLSRRA